MKTESEFSNNHFLIEKSANGENFEILTLVPGKGTTAYASEYFVADFKPFPGVNYYILSQIDNGGNKKQLQTTVCESSLQNEEVLPRLFDVSGRELLYRKILENEIDLVLQQSDMPAGVYLTAIVHRNGKYEVGKFLKQ